MIILKFLLMVLLGTPSNVFSRVLWNPCFLLFFHLRVERIYRLIFYITILCHQKKTLKWLYFESCICWTYTEININKTLSLSNKLKSSTNLNHVINKKYCYYYLEFFALTTNTYLLKKKHTFFVNNQNYLLI